MGALPSPSSPEVSHPPITCRRAETAEELATHFRIRRSVFVEEQGLFTDDDRDLYDDDRTVQHVIGYLGDEPAGVVRLYRLPSTEPGERLWKGDRLAVLPPFRHAGLGGPLVRHAVASGGATGGDRMVAVVQTANVVFFRRLGWTRVGDPITYVGQPHQQMSIELS